ncbi:MAG: excisionase family DNA-binding protein [Lachnospiraceae bacterium]|nr:excisionase family DNA-binding protein [Lachnospiraceae bacterium]
MEKKKHSYCTIRQAAELGIIREHALRVLVRQNRIPFIQVGNRVLINTDELQDYLKALAKSKEVRV